MMYNFEGGNVFAKLQTALNLKNRDIKLFMTSRAEDQKFFNKMEELSQAMLQNGVSAYEVAQLLETGSVRKKMDMLKKLKEKGEQMAQQNQQLAQQQQQQEAQDVQAKLQQDEKHHQDDIQIQTYKIDTEANTAITVERIKEAVKLATDRGKESEPDVLAILAQQQKERESLYERDIKQMAMSMQKKKMEQDAQNATDEGARKDRKLDLEEHRNSLEERKVKVAERKPTVKAK